MPDDVVDPEVRSRILDVIATEGDVDRALLTDEATVDDLGLQSIDMVFILNGIEAEFDIDVPLEVEKLDVSTFGELLAVLSQMISQRDAEKEAGRAS